MNNKVYILSWFDPNNPKDSVNIKLCQNREDAIKLALMHFKAYGYEDVDNEGISMDEMRQDLEDLDVDEESLLYWDSDDGYRYELTQESFVDLKTYKLPPEDDDGSE